MKLAEALSERADLKKRIAQLHSRLLSNAKVQEGEQPAEQPEALLQELSRLTAQLEQLITRINLTNAATVQDGETLTALLARRDCESTLLEILRSFLSDASTTISRGMRTEIRILSTVNVQEYQKQIDARAKKLRELDVRIQSLNWTTDLI